MTYAKWSFFVVALTVVAGWLHYVLPSKDNVRIVGTEVRLEDRLETAPDGTERIVKDDVFFIAAVDAQGTPHVYRNEDNYWYFKFDSANLDAEAKNMVSSEGAPRWMIVTHYGWRVTYFSWYPNAVEIRSASGPDESPFPWFNTILLITVITGLLILRRVLIILRKRHVDPVVDALDQEFDETASWWRRLFKRK